MARAYYEFDLDVYWKILKEARGESVRAFTLDGRPVSGLCLDMLIDIVEEGYLIDEVLKATYEMAFEVEPEHFVLRLAEKLVHQQEFKFQRIAKVYACLQVAAGVGYLRDVQEKEELDKESWNALAAKWRGTVDGLVEACLLIEGRTKEDDWW